VAAGVAVGAACSCRPSPSLKSPCHDLEEAAADAAHHRLRLPASARLHLLLLPSVLLLRRLPRSAEVVVVSDRTSSPHRPPRSGTRLGPWVHHHHPEVPTRPGPAMVLHLREDTRRDQPTWYH
ncbi:hypothetical protein PRIPAC_72733, partial [Pristionchus pacificus]